MTNIQYFCFIIPFVQAIVINPKIAMSTGTTSAGYCLFPNIDRLTPFVLATITPIGPFKLSTHPSKGSAQDGVTIF